MKSKHLFLLLLALIIGSAVYAQTEKGPDGVGGLSFGMSVTQVKEAWSGLGSPKFDYKSDGPHGGAMGYYNVRLGSQQFDICILYFIHDKLFQIEFSKTLKEDSLAQGIYDGIQTTVNNNYKTGDSYRRFSGSYADGDGREMEAVRAGAAEIITFWVFVESSISLNIAPMEEWVVVTLSFQSIPLFEEYQKVTEEGNTSGS